MKIARITLCGLAFLSTATGGQTIYRCESVGGLVYSDKPCATNALIYESDREHVTVYHAPPISGRASEPRARPKTAARSAQKSAAAHAKHQKTCARLEQSLREVRTRLRTGYGVKEGERLKERQRQLAERRRLEKCR